MKPEAPSVAEPGPQADTAPDYAFPVTFTQQRLWFLDQLHPEDTSYLIPWQIRLTDELDVNGLLLAINEIVRRHEILRTTFALVDGQPMQVVAEELAVPLPIVDLSNNPQPQEDAMRFATEEARRPINLTTGPLIRTCLLRLSATQHVLLFTLHHIIFDRWSRGILTREFAALYRAFRDGQPSPLPPLQLQYADYAIWQREYLQGEVLDGQLAYWKKQLAGAPNQTGLLTDRPRPPVPSSSGAEKTFRLSAQTTRELIEFSQRHDATLFMTMLAGFQAVLSRYTGQDDIVVGTRSLIVPGLSWNPSLASSPTLSPCG